jgi:hypothetical protein
MANVVRVPASEQLRRVAIEEREQKLIPINEYKPISSEYSESHPNALSDGDEKGKGLVDESVGGKTDITTRNILSGINQFASSRPYGYPE